MEREPKKNQISPWWQPSLILFGKLSGWISAPVVLALFVGHWLDKRFKTEPIGFLVTVGLAFLISSFGIIRETQRAIKKVEEATIKLEKESTSFSNDKISSDEKKAKK